MTNAAERKDIRKAEKAAKILELNNRDCVVALMSTVIGRSWMWQLLESCHVYNDPFTGDALHEAYLKGERNVGMRFISQILTYCPEQYTLMMREANDRSHANDGNDTNDNRDDADTPGEHSGSEDAGWDVEGSNLIDYDPFNSGTETRGEA